MSELIYRKSKQREKLLAYLKQTTQHPTANELYSKMKKDFPNLSLGTVYRNLNILEKQGLIQKLAFGSSYDRYDYVAQSHAHFICENCGCVLDMPQRNESIEELEQESGMKINRYEKKYFGLCQRCNQ
jgi:Fur family peroxide stress response transcriptional regulator